MQKLTGRMAAVLAALTLVAPAVMLSGTTASADIEAKKLTDPQILGALDAVNDGFIEESKLVTGSKNADVKKLAETIVKSHEDAKAKQADLAKKQKMTPSEPAEANTIRESTKKNVAQLKKLSGAELDRTYVDLMVSEYKERMDLVDKHIIPAATNKDLKEFITTSVRPTFSDNQKLAGDVAKKLAGPPKPTAAD